jgi:tripartite ATP-independent transporter DctM subunit
MHTIILVVVFFVALGIGVPIGMAMLVTSLAMLLFVMDLPLMMLPQVMMNGLTSLELLAVPLFILAAEIMNVGGLTNRIMKAALVIAGRITGGLAQVSILATVIFSGISGSALADAAGLGRIQIRTMQQGGYDLKFAGAVVLASCIIAPLNPLSIIGVIYAVQAHISVGRMLLAGVVPALVVAASLMIYVWIAVKTGRISCPPVETPTARQGFRIILGALPAVLAPAIILAGLVGGILTVTETGAAACVYSLVVSLVFYRELTWKAFFECLQRAVLTTGLVMLMIAAGTVLSYLITLDQGLLRTGVWFESLSMSPALKLLALNVLLLLIGAVIEGIPALLILIPVLLPVATNLGVDPIQFGVIMNFNLCIGLIHPPMGLALFIVSNISGLSTETLAWAVLPFLVPLLIALLLFTYVPGLSLWLPNLLFP